MPPFEKILRGHAWLSLETCVSNLKSVALTVLELLAFNVKNLGGHVTLATPPFRKIFSGHIRTVRRNTHVKCEALAVLNWSY